MFIKFNNSKLEKRTGLIKEILNFSKDKITSMKNEEKLEILLSKIETLNTQGSEYELLEKEIKSLTERIDTLREIETEFTNELENINSDNKESMMLRIEVKSKLEKTYEELFGFVNKREELIKQTTQIKGQYIKEYSSLNKLLSKKANEKLLENKLGNYDTRSFTERFEEAVNNFTNDLFQIKDSTTNRIISSGNVHIYEEGSIVESKFGLDEGTFIVSVSSNVDSVKIGLITGHKEIKLVGKGLNFGAIQWLNDDFGNHLIVKFYTELKNFKEELKKQDDIFVGLEKPKHLYLVS